MESSERIAKKPNSIIRLLDRLLHADDEQQRLLEAFYKEFTTWNWSDLGRKLGGGFMLGIGLIYQIIPFQDWDFTQDKFLIFMGVWLVMIGLDFYISGYRDYTESRKQKTFGEVLMFVPVARRQLAVFRLKRAIPLCFKLSVITLSFQVIFALAIYHGITAGNILFPLVGTFIIPTVWCVIVEYTRGRRGI